MMRIKDIPASPFFELWVEPLNQNYPLVKGYMFIELEENRPDRIIYQAFVDDALLRMQPRSARDAANIDLYLRRGVAHLAEIRNISSDGSSALLEIVFFNGPLVSMGDMSILIDSDFRSPTKSPLETRREQAHRPKGHLHQLEEHCLFEVNGVSYFPFLAGAAAVADFTPDPSVKGNKAAPPLAQEFRAFSIVGKNFRLPVERSYTNEKQTLLTATRYVTVNHLRRDNAVRLAQGKLCFDDTQEVLGARSKQILDDIVKTHDSYLNSWDEYGHAAGERLLKEMRRIGELRYSNLEQTPDGVKAFIASKPEALEEGDEVTFTTISPIYLSEPEMTWRDFQQIHEAQKLQPQPKNANPIDADTPFTGTVQNIRAESFEVKLSNDDRERVANKIIGQKDYYLVGSFKGHSVQIERQNDADKRVREGRSANPQLGLIIEKGRKIPTVRKARRIEPVTPRIREKVFPKNPPTITQRKAIEIALQTPDIALIQGPPGTGKTTVITAIVERLSQEISAQENVTGSILVTSHQHDAVENLTSRLFVNSLPSVKFGKRHGESDENDDLTTASIHRWVAEVTQKVRDRNPEVAKTVEEQRLQDYFLAYTAAPNHESGLKILEYIRELPSISLSTATQNRAETLLHEYEHSARSAMNEKTGRFIRKVRALRTTRTAFLDDGSRNAAALLDALKEELAQEQLIVLERAESCKNEPSNELLNDLAHLKTTLLRAYTASGELVLGRVHQGVIDLFLQVQEDLQYLNPTKDRRTRALANFLRELEDNPTLIRSSIERANVVYGATTQQSEGRAVRTAKKALKEDKLEYDAVFIDEAARIDPRDLLIPMAQAKKKIVLVGDHRQLPHIIEKDLIASMELDAGQVQHLEQSMFEYLTERLRELEKSDGIQRIITLDAQFRMHPLLGSFVNENFYAYYDEKEAFSSPLDASLFHQDLEGLQHRPAAWIDVPHDGQAMRRQGTSWARPAEAQVIANHLARWINSEQGKLLSFGIISFYKAQLEHIYRALESQGICEKAEGGWKIRPEFQYFPIPDVLEGSDGNNASEPVERLRIGTVDAFQGKEFDVVLASVVRSKSKREIKHIVNSAKGDPDVVRRRLCGHVTLPNRLCVSMSRQKKALVMVGDKALAETMLGDEPLVKELRAYIQLCKEQGVILA